MIGFSDLQAKTNKNVTKQINYINLRENMHNLPVVDVSVAVYRPPKRKKTKH
jgi:hypothetical protein